MRALRRLHPEHQVLVIVAVLLIAAVVLILALEVGGSTRASGAQDRAAAALGDPRGVRSRCIVHPGKGPPLAICASDVALSLCVEGEGCIVVPIAAVVDGPR